MTAQPLPPALPRGAASSPPASCSSSACCCWSSASSRRTSSARRSTPAQFRQTSQQLIADPAIQEAVAAQMTDALANVDFTGVARGQAADEPPAPREPDRRSRPGLRGHGGGEPSRPAAHPGRVRRSCRALADAVRQGAARRHEGGGHVERRRRPRHPAARPQAGGPVRVRQPISRTRSRRTPGRSRSSRPTTWRRPRRSPTGSSRSRTSSGSSPSPAWVAAIWLARGQAPAGGSLARIRSRRRRHARAPRAVGRGKVLRRPNRRQRLGAAGGPQRVADHHAVARRCRLGCTRRRHPRRGRRVARRPRQPRHRGPRRGSPRTCGGPRSRGARGSSGCC